MLPSQEAKHWVKMGKLVMVLWVPYPSCWAGWRCFQEFLQVKTYKGRPGTGDQEEVLRRLVS